MESLSSNLVILQQETDRDVQRTAFRWQASGDVFHVTYCSSLPHMLDVERRFNVVVGSESEQLQLRRGMDLVTQDYPYVRAHVDEYEGRTLVRLAICHRLPTEKADRRQVAEDCMDTLVSASREVTSQLDSTA
jgi:hypothetical protein